MRAKPKDNVFTEAERAAVAATARERKAASGDPEQERAEGLAMLEESLAKMPADDRVMGERIHELVSEAVPDLVPGTYYGMPAYKTPGKNGKTTKIYLENNDISKDFHKNICKEADGKKVKVTGTTKKEGGKNVLVASKIEAVE